MSPRLLRSKRSRGDAISFEVASFEYLRTGETDVLLRLEGTWIAKGECGVPGIELRLTRDNRFLVLDPLPDPSNFPVAATRAGTPWRAAFPATLDDVSDDSARYVLSLGDGTEFPLAWPVDRDAKPQPEPTLVAEPEPEPEPEPERERAGVRKPIAALPEADRIKAIIAESIERFAVLEERIEREHAARVEADRQLAVAEAELAEARQLASSEAMAREEIQRQLESGDTSLDETLRRELEQAREAAVRERGQRASFEQELKRRDNEEFELRNSIETLKGQVESLRGELASRDEAITEWQRQVQETQARILSAEKAASEARIARSNLERDLRQLGESGDDPETVLARSKSELADLRLELEQSRTREEQAVERAEELERGMAEAGDDARTQQVQGELDRLKAAAGQATQKYNEEARRRRKLEDELQSRMVAEERLRAMLQAKVPTARAEGEEDVPAEVDIPVQSVDAAVATSQGDFLDRLARAKRSAESIER